MVHASSRTIVHQRAWGCCYADFVKTKPDATDVLVANLRSLMREAGMNKPQLSKKSGVSDRMIAYILAKERTPTIDVAEALAKAFGLQGGWQMMIPGVKINTAESGKIDALVKHYYESSEKGREYIDHVAEREAKYTDVLKSRHPEQPVTMPVGQLVPHQPKEQ